MRSNHVDNDINHGNVDDNGNGNGNDGNGDFQD